MEILILLIFVSVLLVGVAVAFFAWTVKQGTFDQADRLALLPLDDEKTVTPTTEREEDENGNSADRL
jgi:cbb3-type cytochrome oxidase maturation protein